MNYIAAAFCWLKSIIPALQFFEFVDWGCSTGTENGGLL
jgi:hypothetical protein